ncbi:hypothetical protein OG760_31915 [Streptomyces sp. NBC_00963]|uniref:hypothetical protein n=1 Tax=Streptomyces sp. NBC_00963 TaxID=2903697 RepID=UPI0038708D38|nr:hypothetical protein OG760_31915 [Streptomyces sp. NBC_00963]
MRLRSMLVASAFAASAVLGGAASASALDWGHGHEHHHHSIAAAGAFHEEKSGIFYHNIGGPAGITHAGAFKEERAGWFAFMAH